MTDDPPMISDTGLRQAAECLRTLAHPSRLQIVQLLLTGRAYTVGELAEQCGLTQPVTSEHLRLADLMNCIRGRFGSVEELTET